MVRTTFDKSPTQKLFNYLNMSYLEHSHPRYGDILRREDADGAFRYYSSYRQLLRENDTYIWYHVMVGLSPSRKTITVHTTVVVSGNLDPKMGSHVVVHYIDTTATREGTLRIWERLTTFRAMMYHPLAK